MAKLILLYSILFLFAGNQCKKGQTNPDNPYGLPNATQNGANVFACLINGSPFIAYNDVNHVGAGFVHDTLVIAGQPKLRNYLENVVLQILDSFPPINKYPIDNKKVFASVVTDSTCAGINFTIVRIYATDGEIQLTKFDTARKIVSGIFGCLIPVPGCDTLKITEGRFDIIYH